MPPRVHSATLALHIAVSVGWVGALAAYLVLDLAATTSRDASTMRAAYAAMELVAVYALAPLAAAALLSGVAIALGTRWGLLRHYWVVISLLLTGVAAAVLVAQLPTISALADLARDPATTEEQLQGLPGTLLHSVGGLLILLVILASTWPSREG
jgi:hypothetical protein